MRSILSVLMFTLLFGWSANAQDLDTMRQQTVEVFSDTGLGSGVFINDNTILTAAHVVEDLKDVSILISGQEPWHKAAKVIARDKDLDLAIIRLDEKQQIPPLKIDCEVMKWGEPVIVVGFPLGLSYVLTHGYIASTDLIHFGKDGVGLILIDGLINHGNSGGPVFNEKGSLVGILLAGFLAEGKDSAPSFGPGMMRATNNFCDAEIMKGLL